MQKLAFYLGAACATLLPGGVACAEDSVTLDPIVVEGDEIPAKLDKKIEAGSYVGLTPFETPATIDIVTQEEMQDQGLRNLVEVYNSVPGVRASHHYGEPGTTTMRGFRGATGYLIDGVRAFDSLLTSRNFDSYSFERVEVLKGPASVINGTGALAGAINLVTRKPRPGKASQDALLSYGSFNSVRAGAGFNQPVSAATAVNASLVYGQSDGYVDDTDSDTLGFTSGILSELTGRLTVSAAFDYYRDNFETAYFGTPLVSSAIARNPGSIVSAPNALVIDRSMRKRNYSVDDGVMESDTVWLRTNADYKLSGTWNLNNELSYFTADRFWANSEDYTFSAATGLLNRQTTLISHDHEFWSDRVMAKYDGAIGGMHNRFSTGVEYVNTDFGSNRRFGATSAVNPFNPARGSFPVDIAANFATRQDFDSDLETIAVFGENALNFTPQWLGLAGFRYESIELKRRIDNLNTGVSNTFGRDYNSVSWRVGAVYDVSKNTALFAQYNRGTVPVTTLLLSNTARAVFDLSYGQSAEAGIKSYFLNERAVATIAFYQVKQDDILTRDPVNSSLTIQGGSQRSRGVEFDVSLDVTKQWKIGANASLQRSKFTDLRDAAGVSQKGNRPSNVPNHTFNADTSYTLEELPLTLGAGLRHAGNFYTDTANTIKVDGHILLDASISYAAGKGAFTLRGRNLTDEFYADWSAYNSGQVFLGTPRTFDLTYSVKF
ncbi:MAG: TonB-dependent receptor [Alphaproteobacteria bacterium]